MRYSLLLSLICGVLLAGPGHAETEGKTLLGGWYLLDPFQYMEEKAGYSRLTGLDIELLRAIARRAGYAVKFEEVQWRRHVQDIREGKRDIAAAALKTPERENFAYFSIPYREETNALFVRKGRAAALPAESSKELIELLESRNFRLGVIGGYAYVNAAINDYIANPDNARRIVVAENDYQNLRNLMNGAIDGFIADRIVGSTVAWRSGLQREIEVHPLSFTRSLHLMFSKKTTAPETVAAFDEAIRELKKEGEFNAVNKRYMFPILLSLTLDSGWFFAIDVIGTIAFALSGLLLAYKYQYDIFGAFVLAALPAVGGGVIRDVITNREKAAVLADPVYALIIIATVAVGYIGLEAAALLRYKLTRSGRFNSRILGKIRLLGKPVNRMVQIFDALGLAAFTVTGVVVAFATQSEPLWLWGPILAALTGAGGGILRDVLRSDPHIPTLKGELYPEIAFVWGGVLSFFLIWETQDIDPDAILAGIVVTIVGAFATRMLAVHFNLRSPGFFLRF